MQSSHLKIAGVWCLILLCLALARVHFRVVTTNVAYHLGHLKTQESLLLEQRSLLQAELARLTGKRQLENLSAAETNNRDQAKHLPQSRQD